MPNLVLTAAFPPHIGGSSRWFWEIYSRQLPGQYTVVTTDELADDSAERPGPLEVVRIPIRRPDGLFAPHHLLSYLRGYSHLLRIVRREQPDMIHCGRAIPEGLLAWMVKRRTGVPYACYAHGEEVNLDGEDHLGEGPSTKRVYGSRELAFGTGLVLRGAKFVIANSENTQRILVDDWGLPESRVHLLHPGVDTNRFAPVPRNVPVRQELGWENRSVVLTVGRLQRRKGHDRMIEALARIADRCPQVLYAIVGEGEEAGRLKELVARFGLEDHVQFLGAANDTTLLRCYQQCDVFVLPNRQIGNDIEGFGMVLLEAQACGKPVIAGDSGGTGETMDVPHTGLLVACDEADELVEVITDLLADEERRQMMGDRARQWVQNRFDWSSLARSAAEIFAAHEQVVGPRHLAENK